MIAMFFMSIPISRDNNGKKLVEEDGTKRSDNEEKQLMLKVQENIDCDEIKLFIEDDGIYKITAREKIPTSDYINIEKLCRQYSNQDVLVKIRNGRKT